MTFTYTNVSVQGSQIHLTSTVVYKYNNTDVISAIEFEYWAENALAYSDVFWYMAALAVGISVFISIFINIVLSGLI